jgi:hypothetical protein
MNQDNSQPRRPGPVGFNSSSPKKSEVRAVPIESSATTAPTDPEHRNESTDGFRNPGVSRETSSVARTTIETPTRSKELRKVSPMIWMTIGLLTLVTGIVLFTPLLIGAGIATCLVVLLGRRRDRTEDRISREFFE